ncbi:transposase-like zinc-binding domain-containing protein, partial [Corynebacterium accolens]|uniref:transposase-like zinc-binding domain-containing protein n=2 Tax=Corynebacterium TaxID=1716 RepID=UPI003D70D859
MSKNHPRCPVCSGACTKHGTTSTGRQRWRCRTCKATFTRANDDAVQAKWFRLFISWLTSGRSLAETAKTCGVSTRTLQRRF